MEYLLADKDWSTEGVSLEVGGGGGHPCPLFKNWKKVPSFWGKMPWLWLSMGKTYHLKCHFKNFFRKTTVLESLFNNVSWRPNYNKSQNILFLFQSVVNINTPALLDINDTHTFERINWLIYALHLACWKKREDFKVKKKNKGVFRAHSNI